MNIAKTVNLLPLPLEVSEIINSFLFKTFERVVKERKCKIVKQISDSYCSRKDICQSEVESDIYAKYIIDIDNIYDSEYEIYLPFRLVINFCMTCGNYHEHPHWFNEVILDKLLCNCDT